ncbi:MAG: hypothetical protein Q9225_000597 [Loekoesia sp. 1 TL-2023]
MSGDQLPSTYAEPDEDAAIESASGSDEGTPVELLVTGREKRTTAGTRMSTLLEREGDDELELLFAEDEQEEDDEFEEEDAEDGSDVQLDSASSDDDQGSTKQDDDLEGEKELQRQTRVERQKKRKAQDMLLRPGALKKRIRMDSRPGSMATPVTPASRPKKKSERVSWLPTKEEGPVRASSRKQTVKNKELVHSRLVASEKRRKHQLQVMEEAAKRKEASKPKVMTQAQRMEEAARTERSNAKSLNRWEAAEKKRLEEQKAKLEALHNRQLTGPVISWWSGMARWVNDKLKQVGWKSIREAEAKGTHQTKQKEDHPDVESPSDNQRESTSHQAILTKEQLGPSPEPIMPESAAYVQDDDAAAAQKAKVAPPQETQGFLYGIHYYASLPEQPPGTVALEQSTIYGHGEASSEPPEPVTPPPPPPPPAPEAVPTIIPPSTSPADVPAIEYSGRNVVILEDIDAHAQQLPELQNHALLRKKTNKGPKAARALCAITEQPARYRDPKTGLPYADSYAYKEIQKLANGGSRWSSLLGCYVGPTSSGARGVPERFWTNR